MSRSDAILGLVPIVMVSTIGVAFLFGLVVTVLCLMGGHYSLETVLGPFQTAYSCGGPP